jgi:peptidase E
LKRGCWSKEKFNSGWGFIDFLKQFGWFAVSFGWSSGGVVACESIISTHYTRLDFA